MASQESAQLSSADPQSGRPGPRSYSSVYTTPTTLTHPCHALHRPPRYNPCRYPDPETNLQEKQRPSLRRHATNPNGSTPTLKKVHCILTPISPGWSHDSSSDSENDVAQYIENTEKVTLTITGTLKNQNSKPKPQNLNLKTQTVSCKGDSKDSASSKIRHCRCVSVEYGSTDVQYSR